MDLALVIIGLFLIAAYLKNKDLSEKEENKEMFAFLFMGGFWLLLGGLGFIMKSSMANVPSASFLMMFVVVAAAATICTTGTPKIISRVAWVSVLAFIILGSFY